MLQTELVQAIYGGYCVLKHGGVNMCVKSKRYKIKWNTRVVDVGDLLHMVT